MATFKPKILVMSMKGARSEVGGQHRLDSLSPNGGEGWGEGDAPVIWFRGALREVSLRRILTIITAWGHRPRSAVMKVSIAP
jgi:hypothetical protein